jgi:UDP-GlcNAc:undecaprenyl-phosphate GlcNAc-1-phosphate transferase
MGLTHRRAVLILYGICIVFTTTAVAVSLGRSWTVGIALLVASVVVVGIVRFVGYFEYLFVVRRQRSRLRSQETELLRKIIPEAPALLAVARSEADVWHALLKLLSSTGIRAVELVACGDQSDRDLNRWVPAGSDEPDDPEMVSARFPVGTDARARTALKFRWSSDSGEVSPQTEVLLQILVDLVARALERIGSSHGPTPVEIPAALPARHSAATFGPQESG